MFRDEMEKSMLFRQKTRQRDYAMQRAIQNGVEARVFVEFGVAGGASITRFAEALAPLGLGITGFDSFKGLEEDWTGIQTGRAAGAFTQDGKPPAVPDNVRLIKGRVQNTLSRFLKRMGDNRFGFVHMDMDTYSPTRFVLDRIKPYLAPGCIILFDELYGYPGWRHHEYKALQEVFEAKDYKFVSFSTESVAIEMV